MGKNRTLLIALLVLVIVAAFYLIEHFNLSRKELSTYSNSTGNYQCSRPIKVTVYPNPNYKPYTLMLGLSNPKEYANPVDAAEAKQFCQSFLTQ